MFLFGRLIGASGYREGLGGDVAVAGQVMHPHILWGTLLKILVGRLMQLKNLPIPLVALRCGLNVRSGGSLGRDMLVGRGRTCLLKWGLKFINLGYSRNLNILILPRPLGAHLGLEVDQIWTLNLLVGRATVEAASL